MDPLIGWLTLLTLVAMGLLWLVFFPETRDMLWNGIRGTGRSAGNRLGRASRHMGRSLQGNSRRMGESLAHHGRQLTHHRLLAVIIVVALLTPAALVLGLRKHVMLQGYDTDIHIDSNTSSLVASLLRGERLAPPPPLPPEVFVTREVERETPHLHLEHANRKWKRLDAGFSQRLLAVFKIMRERYGYEMVLIEGYRSPERQAQLAAKGASVTLAGPGQSYHQYGLAADCAFYRDGKLVISDKTEWAQQGYALYGKVAEAAGLVWGGSWKSIRDLGHVELHAPGRGPRRHG